MARQAWDREVEQDRAVLEHILALLLALAALVERAAGLPAARRLHLLAALGCSEAEARHLIVAVASNRYPDAPVEVAASTRAAGDAAQLAGRFRMLALAVHAMLARAGGRAPFRHAAPSIGKPRFHPRGAAQGSPLPDLRATSPPRCRRRAPALTCASAPT